MKFLSAVVAWSLRNRPIVLLGTLAGLTARGDTKDAELAGYARPQLASNFQNLDWTVVVEQPLDEAYAPLGALSRDILLHFVAMGLAALALALFVSFMLEKPVTDVEVDLHHDLGKAGASRS